MSFIQKSALDNYDKQFEKSQSTQLGLSQFLRRSQSRPSVSESSLTIKASSQDQFLKQMQEQLEDGFVSY